MSVFSSPSTAGPVVFYIIRFKITIASSYIRYLTSMHEFIIGSTLYVVLAAAESMIVERLMKRSARRAAVVAAFAAVGGGAGGKGVEVTILSYSAAPPPVFSPYKGFQISYLT